MQNAYFTYLMVGIGGILLWYVIINFATQTNRKLKNQEAIIQLLAKLCEKNGVPHEEVENIKKNIGWK